VIRAAGCSPVSAAMAVFGGPIAVAVGGLRGLVLYAGAVLCSRILTAGILAVVVEIERHDGRLSEAGELLVWLPRVVQAVVTVTSIVVLGGATRTVDEMLATVIYAGCVLLGWAARKAATPAIAALVQRVYRHGEPLAVQGPGVSEARIQGWNDAWTRALDHLDRERQAGRVHRLSRPTG
jgi:hypothetical protein